LILPGFLVVFYVSPLEFIYMPEILRSTHTTWMQIVGLALIAASLLVFG